MQSDKYHMSKEGDKYVLTVNNVFGEDADEYCVKASTSAGSRSSRADLTIKSKLSCNVLCSICRQYTQCVGLFCMFCHRCTE